MMTRCIHCTRCVRFASEISEFALGVLDRGLKMEIGMYLNLNLIDELSGNIIDLCPVGALTSMPYAFKHRIWDLNLYSNIDFLDSMHSSIRLHLYSNQIVRILPLLDESINEEWITNKARFSYDSLNINRCYYPKLNILYKFLVISWDVAIDFIFCYIKRFIYIFQSFYSLMNPFIDLPSCLSLKKFFNVLGGSKIFYKKRNKWIFDFKFFYLLNNKIISLENFKFFIFIACNLRLEMPLLNLRIKKNYNVNKNKDLYFFIYGLSLNYFTFPIKNMGNNLFKWFKFLEENKDFFQKFFLKNFLVFLF